MPERATLTKADQFRLTRPARDAECNSANILRAVLRDGFDYSEFKVRAKNEGLADLVLGRTPSLYQIKSRIERRRAERGRTVRNAALLRLALRARSIRATHS